MSLKTILVHVEASPMPDLRLALAIDLANQFDAKLIGIGAEAYRTSYYGDGNGAGYLIAAELEAVDADLEAAEAKFRSAALLYYGKPLTVTPVALDGDGEPPETEVDALTQ